MTAEEAKKIGLGVVMGCPRSGTTFVLRMLDTIYELECASGNLLPIYVPHLVNKPLPDYAYDAMAVGFEENLRLYLQSSMFDSRWNAMRNWFAARASLADFRKALRRDRPVHRLVFKEPFLSFAPQFTYDALPGAPIIYIYRDGRDVADSLVRTYDVLTDEKLADLRSSEAPLGRKVGPIYVPWWVEEGQEEAFVEASPYVRSIWMWKEMVRTCHEVFTREDVQASGRVLMVRYEELMDDPVRVFGEAIDHLGCAMTDRLRTMLSTAHSKSVGVHQRLRNAEIERAEVLAEAELKMLGYL